MKKKTNQAGVASKKREALNGMTRELIKFRESTKARYSHGGMIDIVSIFIALSQISSSYTTESIWGCVTKQQEGLVKSSCIFGS